MKVTVHLEGNNAADLAKGLRAHLAMYEGQAATSTTAGPTKAGKTAKLAKAEEEEGSFELDGGEEAEETEEAEEAEETEITKAQILEAANKHIKKNGREAVQKIFKKFGAKGVSEIDADDYAKIMALLKK